MTESFRSAVTWTIGFSDWQTAMECGARHVAGGIDIVHHPKTSTMRFNDRSANVQPHAHTVGLGAVERLEQALSRGFVHTRPLIYNAHADKTAVHALHDHADHRIDGVRLGVMHGFGCVFQHVHEHLFDQHRIHMDHGHARADFSENADLAFARFDFRKTDRIGDDTGNTRGLAFRFAALHEFANAVDAH